MGNNFFLFLSQVIQWKEKHPSFLFLRYWYKCSCFTTNWRTHLLFLGNALGWELGESMCKNQTASLSTTVSADLPNGGAALNTSNVFASENWEIQSRTMSSWNYKGLLDQ